MELGFLTDLTDEMLEFARETGFTCLEIAAWPPSPFVKLFKEEGPDAIRKKMENAGLKISAIGFYPNNIDANLEARKSNNEHLMWVIEAAAQLEVPVVCTFVGRQFDKSPEENVEVFKETFPPIVEKAEKLGVKIAFENCPGGNIASTPEIWEMIFDAIPSKTIGLEFDPSHLYWLGVDIEQAVREFGDRIYHIHAKDTEIMEGKLSRCGIYGSGWWRYRIPGWGDIDWKGFIRALLDVRYDYVLSIEHEDPVFHGEKHKLGLRLGYKYLSQFI